MRRKELLTAIDGDGVWNPLEQRIDIGSWKLLNNPVAITVLARHATPKGEITCEISNYLESQLKGLDFGQLYTINRWATKKLQDNLKNACNRELVARVEQISNETETIPDWLLALSSKAASDCCSDELLQAILSKLSEIANYTPAQMAFACHP